MFSAWIGGLTLRIGRGGRTPVANGATFLTAGRRLHAVVTHQRTFIAAYRTSSLCEPDDKGSNSHVEVAEPQRLP